MRMGNKRVNKKRKSFGEIVKVFDDVQQDLVNLQIEEEGHVTRLEFEIASRRAEMVTAKEVHKKASTVEGKIRKLISDDEGDNTDGPAEEE